MWHFRQQKADELNYDPIERGSFADGSQPENLVREAIQNSLDAALLGEKVRVRITFSGPRFALPPDRARRYVAGLADHLAAAEPGVAPFLNQPMRFIAVEDFGTTGLSGAIDVWKDDDERNNFYWFWRNVGRTGKRHGSRGSWGVGKWVMPAASQASIFFGLTKSADKPSPVLMGQAVLRTHDIDDVRYVPHGFFCNLRDDDGLQLPISDPVQVQQFIQDFRLLGRTGATGLSLVIPYPMVEVKRTELKRAVLANYFLPILSQQLEVEVLEGDYRERITRDTALEFAATHRDLPFDAWERDLARTIDLGDLLNGGTLTALGIDAGGRRPDWSNDLSFESEALARAGAAFGDGLAVRVAVTVTVQRKGSPPATDEFQMVLQRDQTAPAKGDTLIREGMVIPEAGSLRRAPCRVVLAVGPGCLADLLRDAEEPAHRDWKPRDPRITENYELGMARVTFVKESSKAVFELLSRRPDVRDDDALQDVFYLEEEERSEPPTAPVVVVPPPDPPAPGSRPFLISRDNGGFRVRANVAKAARVTIAYDTRHGNAFTRFDGNDFNARELDIRVEDGTFDVLTNNSIAFRPNSTGAKLSVTGLDTHRDLVVRVVEEAES